MAEWGLAAGSWGRSAEERGSGDLIGTCREISVREKKDELKDMGRSVGDGGRRSLLLFLKTSVSVGLLLYIWFPCPTSPVVLDAFEGDKA